jgi:hypothetical protein
LGFNEAAKECYLQALEIISKMDGEGHVYYATILGNLAGVLEVLG